MKTPPEPSATLPITALPRPHTIAPARERLQSKLLVWGWLAAILPMALLFLWVQTDIAWDNGTLFSGMEMHGVYLCILLAIIVVALRAATPAAAVVGGFICFTMTMVTTLTSDSLVKTAFPSLVALFLLTFAATRLGRARKARLGLAEGKRGRATSQIVANLGIASAAAIFHGVHPAITPACIAVLAESTADTLSSELGPLLRGRTLLLTTLRPVEPGTDGGVSLGGTLFGIAGAAAITTVGTLTLPLTAMETKITFAAALFGFFMDSLLGATLERRGWIGNDWVNFSSTAVTAVVTVALCVWLIP